MSRTRSKPIYGNASTGRARTVITRSGAIFRGKFPSRKNGRMVHHEGLIELDACYLFEMHPLILKYQEQPTTLKYPGGHRLRDYTPDFQLALRTGEVVLVEIKHSEILARKEVREKYDNIATHLKSEETGYVIITEDIIRLEPRLTTMKKAFSALTYPCPTDDFICTAISPQPVATSKFCIFCGQLPSNKNKEHVLPRWLLALTGDHKALTEWTRMRRNSLSATSKVTSMMSLMLKRPVRRSVDPRCGLRQ